MLETTKQGKPVLKFNSQEDREAVSAAIAAAGDALNQAAAAAAAGTGSSTAPAAAAAAAGAAPPASGLVQAGPGLPGQQGSSGLQLTAEQRQALLAKHK
jgi:Spy/CpxP family protein refolding chaperone